MKRKNLWEIEWILCGISILYGCLIIETTFLSISRLWLADRMTAVSRNACWGYKDSYWADRRVALCLVILLLRRSPSSGWTRMTMAHKGISHVRGKILHYNGALSLGWDLYNYFTSRLRPLGGSKPCTPHNDSCSVRYLGARALPVWRDGLPILPKLIFDATDFYVRISLPFIYFST